jgi:uncharacterized protein YkwD
MKRTGVASLFGLLAAASCGDGVGRPILAAATGNGSGLVAPDGGDAAPPSIDVPPTAHCAKVAAPPPSWAASELTFFRAINNYRTGSGNVCGGRTFGNLPPLILSPELRCSARLHALDMTTRFFFSQVNPDNEVPSTRMTAAGFPNSAAAEDIATGEIDPVSMWPTFIVPGENQGCALADPNLTFVGIGRSQIIWAVDVARP